MTKKIIEAKIISNEVIADMIYRLVIQSGEFISDVQPGQFINVYLRDKSLLLPRPISICRADSGQLTLVYRIVGKGTKELSGYEAGEFLSVSTPLGQGYDLDHVFEEINKANIEESDGINKKAKKTIVLAAGGLGVPPMLELAKTIRMRIAEKLIDNVSIIAALGYQNETFLADELAEFCDKVLISTEDGSTGFRGNVLQMLEAGGWQADYYFSCGPKPMLKALNSYCERINRPLQVSLEERMGCGYGACVGCTCKTKESIDGETKLKLKKVCKDGPVFFGNEVVWDE